MPRWAMAAAAVLVIVATLLAYTPTRDAALEWINVHTIFHRTNQPMASPSPLPSGPPGQYLSLGDHMTLDAAQQALHWRIQVPATLGQPDAVYVKLPPSGPTGGMVTLVYAQAPGIQQTRLTGVAVLVTEVRGGVNEQYAQKTLGQDATFEEVTVGGHRGYWISGSPHSFVFVDTQGNPYPDTLRLATNTLVFDDNGTVVRIEGDMTRDQAIQIARSLT